jgi:excinuclease ABC subunit A
LSHFAQSIRPDNFGWIGYLTLFQNTSSLSGGEAQRVKLLGALVKRRSGKLVFLLDEPFRGVDDCNLLRVMGLLYTLIRDGNSVYIAEHHSLALSYCSHIIGFGLEGGKHGGM